MLFICSIKEAVPFSPILFKHRFNFSFSKLAIDLRFIAKYPAPSDLISLSSKSRWIFFNLFKIVSFLANFLHPLKPNPF